jgi:hypothetical protein
VKEPTGIGEESRHHAGAYLVVRRKGTWTQLWAASMSSTVKEHHGYPEGVRALTNGGVLQVLNAAHQVKR